MPRAAARGQRGHHRVDDLRADPGDRRGQDARRASVSSASAIVSHLLVDQTRCERVPGVLKGLRQRAQHRETARAAGRGF